MWLNVHKINKSKLDSTIMSMTNLAMELKLNLSIALILSTEFDSSELEV